MPKVEIKKTINAPQQATWNAISDIERAPEWVVVMQSLIETTENPVQEGTVYRETSIVGPKESETKWKVTKFDPPNVQIHECNEPDFKATLTMRVESNGDETSTLLHTTEYRLMPKFRPLGWLVENLFVKKQMQVNLEKSVENCKQLIESDDHPENRS